MSKGKVYLVGAGPGDPGLFTLKGKECLEQADTVIYDYLANERLLSFVRADAELIYAGKKGGLHTYGQEKINEMIVTRAREGKVVVRLKGGDPFMFGRGGEETMAVADAGIPVEIVPGISAGMAVPAYAGIPLTHRTVTSTVGFIVGQEDPDKGYTSLDWCKIAGCVGTAVFFMGTKNLPKIVEALVENGKPPETPVAVIRWGTTPDQKTVTGTLADIVAKCTAANIQPPTLIVVGEVVKFRAELNWFERKPLFGRKIVVTRAEEQAGIFAREIESAGGRAITFPTIRITAPEDWRIADTAIANLDKFDIAIFTSVNGVARFFERLRARGGDLRDMKGIKLCAIGEKTARAITDRGLRVDFVPKKYVAESVLDEIGDVAGKRILIPRALVAREVMPVELRARGAEVTVAPVYMTIPADQSRKTALLDSISSGEIDAITFTSSSTAKNFASLFSAAELKMIADKTLIAAIGPVTAKTADECGLKPGVVPEKFTIESLAQAISAHFAK